MWFTAAALSGRALFIDWTDSARKANAEPLMHRNNSACMALGRGYACPRVPRRFDLAAHFAASGGRVWRWTPRTREKVIAKHGASAEAVLLTLQRPNALKCEDITRRMLGSEPWLTLRLSDETATALIPHCMGRIRGAAAKGGGGTADSPQWAQRGWPDAGAVATMLAAFGQRLRAAGEIKAADEVRQLAESHGTRGSGRHLGAGLWGAPLLTPKLAQQTRLMLKSYANGDANASSSSAIVDGVADGGVPLLTSLAGCALHSMVRPRKALATYLAPLLKRVGSDTLVSLQLRSGWADDSLFLGDKLALALSQHPSQLKTTLNARRFDYMRLFTAFTEGNSSRPQEPRVDRRGRRRSRVWPTVLADHLHGTDAESIATRRWATITSTPCMASRDPPIAPRDSECLSPSPAYLDRAARAFIRGRSADGESAKSGKAAHVKGVLSVLSHISRRFRHAVPEPLDLPGANQSKFAQVVRCAALLAQSIAHESKQLAEGDGGESSRRSGGWQLYVSSDSPGLRALLERLPALKGHVIGCSPRACSDEALRAGQWRTPSAAEGTALAADLWMFGAADATIAASSTTLTYWASRAPPRDGRPQLLNMLRHQHPAPTLGNKMVPLCPPPPASARVKKGTCTDKEPNYERFPQVVFRPPPPITSADDCFALRFSLLSESAASAIERPEPA